MLRDRPDRLALEPLDLVGHGILFSRFVPQTGGEQIHLMRPGGEVIAFWRNDGTSLAIWTIGADGNPLTERAISAPASTQLDYAPCWSPLGDRIAFQRITNVTAHVWVMDADGSNQQDVSVVAHPVGDPSDSFPNWAP